MRTRTLLILAVVCGFTILAAGTVQLLRIAAEDPADVEYLDLGQVVQVGDLRIVVETSTERGGEATVTVLIGGVDDTDSMDDFRLVVPGESVLPSRQADGRCSGTTVAEQRCVLTFDLGDAPGGSRVLLYRRGDDVARWGLADD